MTRNSNQCVNSIFCKKLESKVKSPKAEWGDKFHDKEWDKYYKKVAIFVSKACKKAGRPVCDNTDSLVRIYYRKMFYPKEGKKYQKLEIFGWYCPKCKNIEIDKQVTGEKFPFHSSWSTTDLEKQWKERSK